MFLAIFCSIILFHRSDGETIPCSSEQDDMAFAVDCSVFKYVEENCSDANLFEHYPNLYKQEYWPERPYDLQLIPTQIVYHDVYLLPGFTARIQPPKTVSIQYTKGFQLDFVEEETNLRKCLIIQLNHNLNSSHRENHVRFLVKLRLAGKTTFRFTVWSLPKPPPSYIDTNLIRYGKTGEYGYVLNPSNSADWLTTISYQNNLEDKNIKMWFLSAPKEFNIKEYNVTLEKVLRNEGKDIESRNTIFNQRSTETHHTFYNVTPGRYRITVLPYDDKWYDITNSRCKYNGQPKPCIRTITSVIVVPEENPEISTLSSQDKSVTFNAISSTTLPVLPSIFGLVAFLLIIVVVVSCYMLHKNTDHKQGLTTISIFSSTKVESHNKVVNDFISFLQKEVYLNVLYYALIENETKFLIDALENSDYVILTIPEIETKKFLEYFKGLDNLDFDREKLILIVFEVGHTTDTKLKEIENIKQFVLMREIKEFLNYILGTKFSNSFKHSVDLDVFSSKEGQRLSAAINEAEKCYRSSSSDSGYPEEGDEISLVSAVTINKDCQECCPTMNHLHHEDCIDFVPPTECGSVDRRSETLNQEILELNDRNICMTDSVYCGNCSCEPSDVFISNDLCGCYKSYELFSDGISV